MPFHKFTPDTIGQKTAKEAQDISLQDWSANAGARMGAQSSIVAGESFEQKQMQEWRSQYGDVRSKMVNGLDMMRQFLELPIQVRHSYEGYPQVDAALVQLESGWWMDACLLADCTFTDDHVAACLNTRTNAPFALDMEFKFQGEEEETEEDEDILALKKGVRDLCKNYFDEMLPLESRREWFRWGILVNLGIGELVWDWHPMQMRFDDSPQLASMDSLFLPVMKTWNPQTVYWRWDTRSFWLVHQSGQTELHPGDGRWVTYSPQGHNHGWLYGAIRQLGKLWLDRVFTYRDWARAEEKFSLGIIKAFEPSGASPADKLRFEQQVTQLPPEATVTLPRLPGDGKEFDLEMMETQQVGSGWEIFERRAENLNRCISILLLGQDLTTSSRAGGGGMGNSSGGMRGNAQVHDSVRKDYMKADTLTMEHAWKTQIFAPFVKRNFEWAAKELGISWRELVPNVRFLVEPPQDKANDAKAALDAANGLSALVTAMAPVDMEAYLEKFDLPVGGADKLAAQPNIGDSNVRPRAPLVIPGVDPDPRAVQVTDPKKLSRIDWLAEFKERIVHDTVARITASRKLPPGLKPSSREGQLFVDRIRQTATQKAAELLSNEREKVLAICRAPSSWRDKKLAMAELFKDADPTELRRMVRHAIAASRFAGRASASDR